MAPSTKLAVLLSVWMCLTLSQTGAIKLICPAGWINLEDASCFKPFTKPLEYRTYERASQVCRTYGSHLAVYNDQYENNALGQVVTEAKSDARKANFWIGFRRVYNEACKCLKFYSESGMERNEADPTNLFWSDRNPDETKGKCVYLEKNDEKYVYDVEYTAAYGSCNTKRSFVCQRPAAPEGSFFCAAGGYVKEPEDVCDGVFDCADGSDEANCPSLCRFKYEMDSGEISLTGYSNSRTCVWAIVTPLGTNAYLEFTSFSTENMADVVHILVGGTSEWSADVNLVAALSGNPNIGDLKYTSYNNMLVVKFDSDNFQTANGFDAKFGSVRDVIADNAMALTATSTKKTVSPPETGNSFMFLGSVDYVWTIRADNAWDIITVQILDFNESTPVTFYDGDSPEAPVLSQLCKACDNYNVVFSTGSSISIFLKSDFGDRSFSFTFRTGCHATFLSSSGELFSPGYPGNIDYANGQICTWIIDAPEPISLYFEGDLDIQDVSDGQDKNSDCLELYTTTTNTTGVKQHPDDCFTTATLSNTRLFQSANGKAFLKFVTSPIRAAKGFLAYFSPDCVDPLYDNKTTGYVGKYYTAKQDMVCAMGYEFSHEAVNVQTVTLECMFGGKWNYKVLPRCAPVYCGQVPRVEGAYVSDNTGVTYTKTASYTCYPGYSLQPANRGTITCQESGDWSARPVCQTSFCPTLNENLPINGIRRYAKGQGSDVTAIIEYECNAGFQLDGASILFCDPDTSTWTHDIPTCQRLTCLLPDIHNGKFSVNTQTLDFEGPSGVICNNGYTLEDPALSTVTCQANRALTEVPVCINTNECNQQQPPCQQNCDDNDGSFTCSCDDGYVLQADGIACADVNECAEGISNCKGACFNEVGTYSCSCPAVGFALYTGDGHEGYYLPEGETGMKSTDTYHIDHSCVRKNCPDLVVPANGKLLKDRTVHRYEDCVEFQCNIGFVPVSSVVLTCQEDGTWSGSLPQCQKAQCPTENVQGLRNMAAYQLGPYNYGEGVQLTCSLGGESIVRNRTCLYSKDKQLYELQGAPYECGVIDCGQPTGIPGLSVPPLPTTLYGSSFTFTCSNGQVSAGKSELTADETVKCQANGLWDYGDLYCSSVPCNDPGTPAGGTLVASCLSDTCAVTYECDGTGMTLSNPQPLTCVGTAWDRPVPTCIDTQKPTFLCPTETYTYDRYTRLGDKQELISVILSAQENTAVKTLIISPPNANSTHVLANDIAVNVIATDFNGNTGTCVVTFKVKDVTPPEVSCSQVEVSSLWTSDQEETLVVLPIVEGDNTITYFGTRPNKVSADNLYQTFTYTVVAKDAVNNEKRCSAQLFVKPHVCSPLAYPSPRNAAMTYTSTRDINGDYTSFTVTITCAMGYVFPNGGTSRTRSCSVGNEWRETDIFTGCIQDVESPVLQCPLSYVVYHEFNSPGTVTQENLLQRLPQTSDNSGLDPELIYSSDTFPYTEADIHFYQRVSIKATDQAGNSDSCYFDILVLPSPCSNFSFPTPLNGAKSCSQLQNGWTCTITCNPGYLLRDDRTTTKTVTCDEGTPWSAKAEPACVLDTHPPVIKCPDSYDLYLAGGSEVVHIAFSDLPGSSVADDGDIEAIVYNPPERTFSIDERYTTVTVKMTVADKRGLSSSCNFYVTVLPNPCSPEALPTLLNVEKECTQGINGYTCILTPNPGYQFYSTGDSTITLVCSNDNAWDLRSVGTAAASESDPGVLALTGLFEYIYAPGNSDDIIGGGCQDYYRRQLNLVLDSMAAKMKLQCSVVYDSIDFVITLESDPPVSTFVLPGTLQQKIAVVYTVIIRTNSSLLNTAQGCFESVRDAINDQGVSYSLNNPIAGDGTCPRLVFNSASQKDATKIACFTGFFRSKSNNNICLRCPAGTYEDSENCIPCPKGSYRSPGFPNSCSSCGSGTTRTIAAVSISECINECSNNLMSSSGYVPCHPCAVGQYRTSSSMCQNCAFGQTTATEGHISVTSCTPVDNVKENCGQGTFYDAATSIDCQLCPFGEFQSGTNAVSCVSCSTVGLTTTYITGATSSNDCRDSCPPGFASSTGISPCNQCSRNSYSESPFICKQCPDDSVTPRVGAMSIDECVPPQTLQSNCPPGTFRNSTSAACDLCARNFYSSSEEASSCTPCPANTGTYRTGASSFDLCFDFCPPGFTSPTNMSPCTACAVGEYYNSGDRSCNSCPNGGTTTHGSTLDISLCRAPCGSGQFSYDGYEPCTQCPINYYQSLTGQWNCTRCNLDSYTNGRGSTASSQCLSTVQDKCQTNPCANDGVCIAQNNEAVCGCPKGFYGLTCTDTVKHCDSSPCYNGGFCQESDTEPDGFTCDCQGSSGDRCETFQDHCNSSPCLNGGGCYNTFSTFKCLCLNGFSGTNCLNPTPVCASEPCQNGGICQVIGGSNVRYKCNCPPGWDGKDCSNNIDDCAANPCLNGGNCVDRVDNYRCDCTTSFSGKNCLLRTDVCSNTGCGVNSVCFADYRYGVSRCICKPGYYYGSLNQYRLLTGKSQRQQVTTSDGSSAEECRQACNIRPNCLAFSFTSPSSCRLYYSSDETDLIDDQATNYYIKVSLQPADDYWTPWYSANKPNNLNNQKDSESRDDLNTLYQLSICKDTEPIRAECRRVSDNSVIAAGSTFDCNTNGMACKGSFCEEIDYAIRFKCGTNRVFKENSCFLINNCENANQCNGGQCNSLVNDYTCGCPSYKEGKSCQTDKDFCAGTNPCNGGTCKDNIGSTGYTCSCPVGFTGVTCANQVNFCTSAINCNSGSCQNLATDYQCNCQAGYSGRHCETNIQECLSTPCLHGGTCSDDVNDYTCDCEIGWEGKNCETSIDGCTSLPCVDVSTESCHTIFNGHYCNCKNNRYGERCEHMSSPCTDSDKCLNGGKCLPDDTLNDGTSCECTNAFTGEGCQIQKDFCGVSNPCMHGTCLITLTGYGCDCYPGFQGKICDMEINECASNPCMPWQHCIDGDGNYKCECSIDKTGENCSRQYDPDFDIFFRGDNSHSLSNLIPFSTWEMSISLWVRFLTPDSQGVFVTVSTGKQSSSASKFIEFDELGVSVYSKNGTNVGGIPYRLPHMVNDGDWHSVVITVNYRTGTMTLYLNTIKMSSLQLDYSKLATTDTPFSSNLFVVLGCELDLTTSRCRGNSQFKGVISQLNVYTSILTFEIEIPNIVKYPKIVFSDPILVWNINLILNNGAVQLRPSFASATPCMVSQNCRFSQAKVRPSLATSCIPYHTVNSNERLTSVSWSQPIFNDASMIDRSLSPGTTLHWGNYYATYIATAANGNTATCTTRIYVTPNQCERNNFAEGPLSGLTTDSEGSLKLSCFNLNTFVIDRHTPKYFSCGPSDNMNVKNMFQRFRYPPCGEIQSSSPPKVRITIRLVYNISTSACHNAEDEFKTQIKVTLNGLQLCGADTLCSQVIIDVICGPLNTRSRRQASDVLSLVNIIIPDAEQEYNLGTVQVSVEDFIIYQVLGANVFRYDDTIPGATIDPDRLNLDVQFVCPYNLVLLDNNCVECGAGTYFKYVDNTNISAICEDCPIGSYQNQPGQDTCTTCEDQKTTEMTGTNDATKCKSTCEAGSYFDRTTGSCAKCPVGYHQRLAGMFYCDFCLRGTTTRETGSLSSDSCYETCPSGSELNASGVCELCPIGKYRNEKTSNICEDCPPGYITASTGATSNVQCDIRACEAGYSRNIEDNVCVQCAIGFYQNERYQDSCKQCGPLSNWRTNTDGSTQQSDCQYFCPSGYEKVVGENRCVECSIGEYKDNNDGFYGLCINCPNNLRTVDMASTSVHDCTIYMCIEGERPNVDNTGCDACPLGEYQPAANSIDCIECPIETSTRQTGTTLASKCEEYCDFGYEESDTGPCQLCGKGYYKDNDANGLFSTCTECRANYTTVGEGSRSANRCSIRACKAGSKRNADESACIPCPLGEYQVLDYMSICSPCPVDQSTVAEGADSKSLCKDYCQRGSELTVSGCRTCPIGYFKDNDVDLFSNCELCPEEFITELEGAGYKALCTVKNCSAGYKRNTVSKECDACPKGYYQDQKWQTSCIKCPIDTTTETMGSTDRSDCIIECQPGFEDKDNECVPCPRGFYKDTLAAAQCTTCGTTTTTETTGANSSALCVLPACYSGTYLSRTDNACINCAYDKYQDEIWTEMCKECPINLVTLMIGADSQDDCVQDCLSGREYVDDSKSCRLCSRGYYRNRSIRSQIACMLCPTEFITSGDGAEDFSSCAIANCTTPGQYIAADNTCQPCPIGTYSSTKWQTQCSSCSSGFSTTDVGSTSSDSCKRTCPSGSEVNAANQCVQCSVGKYRNAASGSTTVCLECPDGRTTAGVGSTSSSQCSLTVCNVGQAVIGGQCKPCLKGTYQPAANQFDCITCPVGKRYTQATGSTQLSECRSTCSAGEKFDIPSEQCSKCEVGYYQPEPNQFTCIACLNGKQYTNREGAVNAAECMSLCASNQNDCSDNATCTNTPGSFVCKCFSNYESTGTLPGRECIHKCDNSFCQNGAACVKSTKLSCVCNKWFEGTKCQTRVNSREQSDKAREIGVPIAIGAGALLLILIILATICILRARKTPKKTRQYSNYNPEKTEQASVHSFDRHPAKVSLAPHNEMDYHNPAYDNAVYQA